MTRDALTSTHVVVAFRMPRARARSGGRGYLECARALARRAEVLGAELVAWGAANVAFAWDPELLEEAVSLVVGLREATGLDAAWACGVSEGVLEPLEAGGRRATLAWGEPLLRAVLLSRLARSGEVVLDEEMRSVAEGALGTLELREGHEGDATIRGALLDTNDPWRPVSPSRPPPPTEDAETYANQVRELTRQTLRSLKAIGGAGAGAGEALGERMRAVARLKRGQIAEALRSLEQARADAADGPQGARCQASLALSLALMTAGRPDESMLEALDALAHARAAEDARAAGACIALLAKLFARVGRGEDAERLAAELAHYPRPSMLPPAP